MDLYERFEGLNTAKESIENAKNTIIKSFESGGKLLLCGNGGSCADCDHIVGELMKGFLSKRSLSEAQKQEMINILDTLKDTGINTVMFQVRPKGDALYKSSRHSHSERMANNQENITSVTNIVFCDIITNIERIGDHCTNIIEDCEF